MFKSLTFFLALVLCTPLLHAADDDAILTQTKLTAIRTHVFNGHVVAVDGKHRDFFDQAKVALAPLSGPDTTEVLSRMGKKLLGYHGKAGRVLTLCVAWYQAHKNIDGGSEGDLLSHLDACPEITGNPLTDLERYLTPDALQVE